MELKSDSIEANASTLSLSLQRIPSTIVTVALSLIVHIGVVGMEKAALCSGVAQFFCPPSHPSALICLSDACDDVPLCCASERKHRAEPLPRSLKKPFNLGFLCASSTCATCGSQCSGSASCQSVSQYPPRSQPENTAVTTGEYPLPAATNTVNKQCWLGNPTSRPVNYTVNKSNMLFCFSQVCSRLQQRKRFLRQTERVQVSKPFNMFNTIWYNLRMVEWCQAGGDLCHRGVRWFTCPWLPSGPGTSPDNLTGWWLNHGVDPVMPRLPYDPNIDTLSLGRSEDCYIA